jgi:hypothetical protein
MRGHAVAVLFFLFQFEIAVDLVLGEHAALGEVVTVNQVHRKVAALGAHAVANVAVFVVAVGVDGELEKISLQIFEALAIQNS